MATTPQADASAELRIWLLGGFRVRAGSREIDPAAWRLRKAKSLVKLLALTSGHRLHREQVMETLWPHLDPAAASNNLRKVLHIVRRTLEPGAAGESGRYCRVQDDVISLAATGGAWVDVDAFAAAAGEARRRGDAPAYQAALDLYAGDLLPEDRYEEWSTNRRDALHQESLSLLADLAAIHESEHNEARAIEMLQALIVRDPGREEAHRSLMRLYALSGQRQQALRQYQLLKESLSREFEAEPDEASRRLYEDVQAGRFSQAESAGRKRARPRPDFRATGRTNVPLPLTSFVGRVRELAELRTTIVDSRQLTLTGAGGVGKTRLALEVAARVLQDFPDGVWVADLSVLANASLVPQAVAAVVNVREEAGRSLSAVLSEYFLAKHALLVLDNCEHVAGACAQLAEHLLRRCADLHVLATSREVLGMQGELVHRVASLSVPDARRPCPVAELGQFEAVRLFVDRAGLSQPGFGLTDENAPLVGRICVHLDGIPLAIELAAARLNALPVNAIAARLDSRFRLLTGGTRTALSRHQTLRAAMEWSYDLLAEPERALLRALSVCAGGFSLDAAQAIGATDHADEMDVLELLGRLVDKSMVQLEKPAASARYRLLETVRDFVREKLVEAGEADAARRRHAAFFLGLVRRAEPELRGPRQASWLDRLEADHDNLRAALEWSLSQERDETGLCLATALSGYWHGRGYLSEGREWLERAQRHGDERPAAFANVLVAAARLAFAQDDFERAVTLLERAVPLARSQDPEALMLSLAWLGHALWHRDDRTRAIALCMESHALCRSAEAGWTAAVTLAEIATVALHEGDPERAIPLLEESLGLYRKAGDSAGIAQCLHQLGVQATNQGEYAKAASLMQEALELQRHLGRKPAVAASLLRLGRIALLRGQYREAIALLEAGTALADELGKTWDAPYRKASLGLAVLATGDVARAAALFEESLAVREAAGYRGSGSYRAGSADALLGLGIVARYREEYPQGRRLLEDSLQSFRAAGDTEGAATALYQLGLVAHTENDLERAAGALRESLTVRQARGDRLGVADCVEAMAAVVQRRGALERSAQLVGLAASLREEVAAPRWAIDQVRYDRELAALRATLGEETFAASYAAGVALTFADLEQTFAVTAADTA